MVARTAASTTYYVYTYAYPESMGGKVFYVGKGTGNRINQHERDALSNAMINPEKERVIRTIWGNGESVVKEKVAFFENEKDAFEHELHLINVYGIHNLTNQLHGPADMVTLDGAAIRNWRLRAHMTVFQLSGVSGVSIRTINRIENEEEHYVTSLTAQKLIDTLSEKLGQQIGIDDVEGLKIKG